MQKVSLEVVFLHVHDHKQWISTVFLVSLWLKAAEEIDLLMQLWFKPCIESVWGVWIGVSLGNVPMIFPVYTA